MDIKNFKAGSYKEGYQYSYFLPEKINHPFTWTAPTINTLLEKASFKLGELNSFSHFVPDIDMFIIMHILKEAVVSSKIEGTRTSIADALSEERDIDPEKRDDWLEVHNYVKAMNSAIGELEKLPLSSRLLKNTHRILLSSGRGDQKSPGEFRRSQNWIGGASLADAVFVPPAHTELPYLLSDLEAFLNNEELQIPHIIKIAIAHYQFETIHPFLDGNGRVGRLLITLCLVAYSILDKPLLNISDFFEQNRALYYENLTLVRTQNNLTQWIKYFLVGLTQTADNSVKTLKGILTLKTNIEQNRLMGLGRRTQSALQLFGHLFKKPLLNVSDVQTFTNLSPKAANDLVAVFIELGILKETTGYQRNRIFIFNDYVDLF
ncbi:MAG: Fic family protein [Sphaerochaetaceae bacterium]